jgi:hypothetical protein
VSEPRKLRSALLVAAAAVLIAAPAHAIPALQLYIEGAAYDQDTSSWVTNQSSLTLWVVGDTGRVGSILDVHLVTAYLTGETGSITFTPISTGLLSDPSVASIPALDTQLGADGTQPRMSDGRGLPRRDTYGPGTSFKQWALGDFTLGDSPVGDFAETFPGSFPSHGQINAYRVAISGYSTVHFDAFNHVEAGNRALFGPFAPGLNSPIPEPSTLLMLGLAFTGVAGLRVVRRRR